MRKHTQRYAMSIKTMRFSSVSKSLFLLSEQFDAEGLAIVRAG